MEEIQFDWIAIILAALLNMAIGFLWYSKWLFGKTWLRLAKKSEGEMKKGRGISVFYGFITSLVIAFFLAFFEGYLGVTTVSDGMFVGFCLWLGFVATTQVSLVIWANQPFSLFLLDTGYKLLSFLVMGGIIGA